MPFPVPNIANLINKGAVVPRAPTAARTFVDSVVLGNKAPITEANFAPAELEAMRTLTQNATTPITYNETPTTERTIVGKPGAVTYNTYHAAFGEQNPPLGLGTMNTPQGNVKTSLGQFNYKRASDGSTIITDKYKFNPSMAGPMWEDMSLMDKASWVKNDPYGALRAYGETVLPQGTGRNVNVKLPPLHYDP